jgi:phospholipase C
MSRRPKVLAGLGVAAAAIVTFTVAHADPPSPPDSVSPIKHVVVIFQENVSFDHYFATYPSAANPAGEPAFSAASGTPQPDNLAKANLLSPNNPNSKQPARIGRANALTCDQGHAYGAEQSAAHGGAMDKFVENTAGGGCADKAIVMSYFDGNTVTAMWNYAQHYSMSDNFFGTGYGPSTPGALNLISGNTHGATAVGGVENGTVIGDPDPADDDCSAKQTTMTGRNVGDLMNDAHVTWGWFQGGFKPTTPAGTIPAVCGSTHTNIGGATVGDYSAHHEPFQYYASTRNSHHLPPSSTAAIGTTDQANHQYDLTAFKAALDNGTLPQVTFLKAASYQDGHAGYSDPLDEQRFLAEQINAIESSPAWASTAIIVTYDDSDGWYDHKFIAPQNGSQAPSDQLDGPGQCGAPATPVAGGYQDRCGPGPRLPLLVISPYAKQNAIDHTQTEQASVLRFIEDNWSLGRIGDSSADDRAANLNGLFDFSLSGASLAPKVLVDPSSGLVSSVIPTLTPPSPPGTTTTAPVITPPPVTVPKPTPVVKKPKLTLSIKRSGRKITLTLKLSATLGKKAKVKVRLTGKHARSYGTASTTLTSTARTKKLSFKAKRTLTKGKYTLSVTVTPSSGKALTTKQTLTVR